VGPSLSRMKLCVFSVGYSPSFGPPVDLPFPPTVPGYTLVSTYFGASFWRNFLYELEDHSHLPSTLGLPFRRQDDLRPPPHHPPPPPQTLFFPCPVCRERFKQYFLLLLVNFPVTIVAGAVYYGNDPPFPTLPTFLSTPVTFLLDRHPLLSEIYIAQVLPLAVWLLLLSRSVFVIFPEYIHDIFPRSLPTWGRSSV